MILLIGALASILLAVVFAGLSIVIGKFWPMIPAYILLALGTLSATFGIVAVM